MDQFDAIPKVIVRYSPSLDEGSGLQMMRRRVPVILLLLIYVLYTIKRKTAPRFLLFMFVLRSRHRHNDDTRRKTQVHVRR